MIKGALGLIRNLLGPTTEAFGPSLALQPTRGALRL